MSSQQTATEDIPLPNAGLIRRLAAMFYDFMLLLGVILSTAIIVPAVMTLMGFQEAQQDGQVVHEIEPFIDSIFIQLYFVLILVAFNCGFWLKNGQTLGMQSWRLKLVSVDQQPLSFQQCLIRLTASIVSFLCFGAGYWWQLVDKDKLTWHDRWSRTRVLLLPKKKK